jgi:hypothetical protein
VTSINSIYSLNSIYDYFIQFSEKRRNYILRVNNFQYGSGFSGEIMIEDEHRVDPDEGVVTDYEDDATENRLFELQNDDECIDIIHEVLLEDIFVQNLFKRPLERFRNGPNAYAIRDEFFIEIYGWLTTCSNLVGHKNMLIDEEPLVKYEIVDAKYAKFGHKNEVIIETYGSRQKFILEGELVRHSYTHSIGWG